MEKQGGPGHERTLMHSTISARKHMPKQLVFIGDSLTEWFDWQKRFPGYDVMNLGISGEHIEGLLDRRDRVRSLIDSPDYIFLMTGINNIAMEQYDILGPYTEIVRNLTTWYKKATLVVQSILPVELSWISNEVIRATNRHLEQLAHRFNTEYLDVYAVFTDSKGDPKRGYLQEDGVHLGSAGYQAWANEIEMFLSRHAHQ